MSAVVFLSNTPNRKQTKASVIAGQTHSFISVKDAVTSQTIAVNLIYIQRFMPSVGNAKHTDIYLHGHANSRAVLVMAEHPYKEIWKKIAQASRN